jgi:tetratricopeptide (TPR) repeat protein
VTVAAALMLSGCATEPAPRDPARRHSGPEPSQSPCEDFALDAERVWSRDTASSVRLGLLEAGGRSSERTVERIVTKMDALTRDWVMMREKACKDTLERALMPPEVYVKVSACLDVALVQQRTAVSLLASPQPAYLKPGNRIKASGTLDALDRISAATASCQYEAVYTYYGADPAIDEALARGSVYARFEGPKASTGVEQTLRETDAASGARARFERRLIEAESVLDTDLQRGLEQANGALDLALTEGYEAGQAEALMLIADAQWMQGNPDEAIRSLSRALRIRDRLFGATATPTQQSRDRMSNVVLRSWHDDLVPRALALVEPEPERERAWLWTLAFNGRELGLYEKSEEALHALETRTLSAARRVALDLLRIENTLSIGERDIAAAVQDAVTAARREPGPGMDDLVAAIHVVLQRHCAALDSEARATRAEQLAALAQHHTALLEALFGTGDATPPANDPTSVRAWLDYPAVQLRAGDGEGILAPG